MACCKHTSLPRRPEKVLGHWSTNLGPMTGKNILWWLQSKQLQGVLAKIESLHLWPERYLHREPQLHYQVVSDQAMLLPRPSSQKLLPISNPFHSEQLLHVR